MQFIFINIFVATNTLSVLYFLFKITVDYCIQFKFIHANKIQVEKVIQILFLQFSTKDIDKNLKQISMETIYLTINF
jgi:hypothetical protein